jgi:hypothetical protein
MTLTFFINAILTALLAIIPNISNNPNYRSTSYIFCLIILSMYGCSVAILQVTLYSIAGPKLYLTSAFMIGIGLSSFIINFLRIFMLIFIKEN